MVLKIELLGKPGCHLCDEAKIVLERICRDLGLSWDEVNIEEHSLLFERYKEEIPVLLLDGRKVFKYRLDAKLLRTALTRRLR